MSSDKNKQRKTCSRKLEWRLWPLSLSLVPHQLQSPTRTLAIIVMTDGVVVIMVSMGGEAATTDTETSIGHMRMVIAERSSFVTTMALWQIPASADNRF